MKKKYILIVVQQNAFVIYVFLFTFFCIIILSYNFVSIIYIVI